MVKASNLAYSVEFVRAAWAADEPAGLSLMLQTSAALALEALERAGVKGVQPFPDPGGLSASAHYRAVADWTLRAVINDQQSRKIETHQRMAEAVRHLRHIAEVHELLMAAPSPEARTALAEAVMLGALLGEYKWRNPPHREKGTSPFSVAQLEEITRRRKEGQTGVAAAKAVLGPLEVGAKNRYDSAVKAARRLEADRAALSPRT